MSRTSEFTVGPSTQRVPSRIFAPHLPAQHTDFARASQLLHLKVGLLNVAWQNAKQPSRGDSRQPPMTQPLTLPLMLHLHPSLLTRDSTATTADATTDAFMPPTLRHMHASLLPSILRALPSMIGQIKIKKLESVRGNRVGIMRNDLFVFTFTFKETQPAYHLLTISAKRIRAQNAAARAADEARHGGPRLASRPGYSLSSHLSNFDLFDNPDTRIELAPITRSGAARPDDTSDAIEGEGYYQGQGYASYLVSRHTLHVRLMPKRRCLDTMEAERRAEYARRTRQDAVVQQFGAVPKSHAHTHLRNATGLDAEPDEEAEETKPNHSMNDEVKEDVDSDFEDAPPPAAGPTATSTGRKRKPTAAATGSASHTATASSTAHASKKSRRAPASEAASTASDNVDDEMAAESVDAATLVIDEGGNVEWLHHDL